MVGTAQACAGGAERADDDVMCVSSSPNFYILDEPTNHLDMETIEALAKALTKFKVRSLLFLRPSAPQPRLGSPLTCMSCFRAGSSWCPMTSV